MDPNGAKQFWSEWRFYVRDAGKNVSRKEVELNALRWLRMQFGSVGTANIQRRPSGWRIRALVEGAPAHDPLYVEHIRLRFARFVFLGWGALASSVVEAKVMAGDTQDGRPRPQMVVIPRIELEATP